MKKILLSASAMLIASVGFSQSPAAKVKAADREVSVSIPKRTVINENPQNPNGGLPANFSSGARNAQETVIGQSTYDLQSNSSIQRRIIKHDNGTITAAWTYSDVNSWADRGTGYNYFNGNIWGAAPTSEIETERTGWPSLMATGSGKEVIISHSTASSILRKSDRSTIGSGTWSQANQSALSSQVWNRATTGGPGDNTIHLVSMTLPEANNGTAFNGMDGAFLYNRSLNGGVTWDIVDYQIPGTDSNFFSGFDGDSYHIDARGNTVAIVVGGLGTGIQLYKSTNNGFSWTKKDVVLSDVWYDEATTYIGGSLDSALYTSDGTVNVLIDNNDMCHVWFGRMFVANDVINDGSINYFPGTNSIDYWNENMNEDQPIGLTGALDINGNGQLDLTGNVGDVTGQYRFSGLASHPQAGIDSNGCMYVVYSAIREDLTNGAQHYRHTYLIRSCDNGCSWSFPIDITDVANGANDFRECVYASIARKVDDDIHVVYMSDLEPGIAVSGDEDAPSTNDIIYLTEQASRFDTTAFCPAEIVGDSMVCPGGTLDLEVIGCASAYSWAGPGVVSGGNTATVTVDAIGTYSVTVTQTCGTQTLSFDVVAASGNGPTVQVNATNLIMCPGDTSHISAISNTGGSVFLWSTGSTTSNITVNNPGTYTVTVADCNGQTTQSITIDQPVGAPIVFVSGDTSICPGQTTTLTASAVSGGSYLWSTGSTSIATTVTSPGTYTVTATNCGGTSFASWTITSESAPVATLSQTTVTGCEGAPISVSASGGTSFLWSNGSTSPVISISSPAQSGTYTVTVSNSCGETDVASATLTIFENPAAPVVTFDGTNYVSSQTGAGTHTWYINGTPLGETSNTLPGTSVNEGAEITCEYTDENGCISPLSEILVGLNEMAYMNENVSVFPNPNNGIFEVRFGDINSTVTLEVTNAIGQMVYNDVFGATNGAAKSIDLSALTSGIYQISISAKEGKTVKSVVIE